jgi:hypothetical protein
VERIGKLGGKALEVLGQRPRYWSGPYSRELGAAHLLVSAEAGAGSCRSHGPCP